MFKIYDAPVSWRSMLQATVALSTIEAEYMIVTVGVHEALWLWGFLDDLGFEQDYVDLWCNSQGVIHLAKNQVYHTRTKHINVIYHFVWDVIEDGDTFLMQVHMDENPVDMVTKVVPGGKFKHCLNLLNISQC